MEWIIVDDGTDKIRDMVEESGIPQIRYIEVADKMSLGAKRNYMHTFVKGSIIVYMDDDDYYPPDRVSHAVSRLQESPNALCAGSSEIYIYFKQLKKMIQCGPYGPNHATAGTFAFKKELLAITKYEEHAALAEERAFLKEYTIPFVQLDPMKSILVFSHDHNTFDKRKMFDNPHPDFFKESTKTVENFITKPYEGYIKNFFMYEIDSKLAKYEPGLPKMKPEVLEQIKVIEANRDKMIKEEMEKQRNANGAIMVNEPGKEPRALTSQEIITIINQQRDHITNLTNKTDDLEKMIVQLQKQLLEKSKEIRDLKKASASEPTEKFTRVPINIIEPPKFEKSKSMPEVMVDVNMC